MSNQSVWTIPAACAGAGAGWGVLGLAADADRVQVTRPTDGWRAPPTPTFRRIRMPPSGFAAIANAYRRAIEAVQEQDAGCGETEASAPRAGGRRRSETSPWSTDGAVWVHVSTPVTQRPLGAEPTQMMLRLGGARLGYSSRRTGAPIVAGPVQVQPLSDTNPLNPRDPGRWEPYACRSVWPPKDASDLMVELGHDRALYSISVTSELTGVNPPLQQPRRGTDRPDHHPARHRAQPRRRRACPPTFQRVCGTGAHTRLNATGEHTP